MAAISAVSPSFASPIHTLKTLRSKNDSFFLKTSSPTTRISLSYSPFPSAAPPRKWVSSAVEQEEAGLPAPAQAEEGEEVSGSVEAEGAVSTKLYFGNLPYRMDSSQLAGIIQEYAEPELIEVLYNRETGVSRGYAFVSMSSIEDCNAVIENLDGRDYMGRKLRVNLANQPRKREDPLYPETEHKLFVGNLAWTVTTEILTQAFQEHGNVVGARVLVDGETGKARGFGFVCYATRSEMEAALEAMHGVELEGRAIRVSEATGTAGKR